MGSLSTPTNEEAKARLRVDFPAWSIIHTSDTGRWWAHRTRERAIESGLLASSPEIVTELHAATPEQLRAALREVTADEERNLRERQP